MSIPLVIADAFTDRPFGGNPAAVCLLERAADESWMQAVAAEMNLSETAFVVPAAGRFGLRWFTPTVEVDLCGHATLAASHVLWETGRVAADRPIEFSTRSGVLTCTRRDGWISMDFPAEPPDAVATPPELAAALGVQPLSVARNRLDYLVELPSEQAVRGVRPDFAALERIPARGAIVTAPSDEPRFDFVSRFFAPACGIDEDPVCGSAHCCLGPFWSARLGQPQLVGRQVSRRGGVIRVRIAGPRVVLSGQAVTTMEGTLH